MIRIKPKYSLFCKKRPQKGLIYACVYFPNVPVWKICQGKLYADGRFRYINNGIEGIARQFNVQIFKDFTRLQLRKAVIEFNKKLLESLYRKQYKSQRFHYQFVGELLDDLPVVELEDDADDLIIENG